MFVLHDYDLVYEVDAVYYVSREIFCCRIIC